MSHVKFETPLEKMSKLLPRIPKNTSSLRQFHSKKHIYEIPERYRNSFYLANAALFDSVSWYVHRAYEVCFSDLIGDFVEKNPQLSSADRAVGRVEEVIKLLDQCSSVIDVRYPIKRNDGRYDVIRGFRAQHGLATGHVYCLGGLRISQNITRDHMKALATLSTYKHACLGLNLAGAWGGIKVDPINYNENELKLIVEGYVSEMLKRGYCGRNDLIEPDINTSKREMLWISAAKKEKSNNTDETVTAGSNEEIASQAIAFALEHFLNQPKILDQLKIKDGGLKNKTYIIQGLGKLGCALAKYLSSNGAICVGAKEHDAYIYNSKGIDVKALLKHKNEHGSIINFDVTKPCTNDDIYTKDCDILILAALQKSLVCHTAPNVKAKIIVEAADGAITPTSHKIFTYSKLVLPDIFISSAYHVASSLEFSLNSDNANKVPSFVQDIYKDFLDTSLISQGSQKVMTSSGGGTQQKLKTFNKKHDIISGTIEHVLTETTNDIVKIADQYKLGLDYRTASYIKSLKYIFGSIQKNRTI